MLIIPRIIKYIIIGLAIGIIISVGYYFLDYQSKPEGESIGISKEKVLLSDQNTYDVDIVLNSIISNQIVLQDLIKSLREKDEALEKEINLIKENDNNQSE